MREGMTLNIGGVPHIVKKVTVKSIKEIPYRSYKKENRGL